MRVKTAIACLALTLWASAAAADPGDAIGSAVTVVNYVTASLDTNLRQLETGDDVRQQELIEVDPNGRSELELNDRTKLALGPGSRLLLDRFVYDPDLSGGAIVMNLIHGTFRFMTGIAAKPAYVIRTPVAAITVRGTIFDVYVMNPSETWLLLHEGGVEVCTGGGDCLVHDQPGKLIRITADGIGAPAKWAALKRTRDVDFDDAFPFVSQPPGIDPDPIFTRDDIVLGADTQDEPETYQEEKPRKVKPQRHDDGDDYTPPPRKTKKIEYREYREYRPRVRPRFEREVRYYPKRSRGREILKKGVKAGVVVGAGLGAAYALGKLMKRRY
jgi:hypothetical protein